MWSRRPAYAPNTGATNESGFTALPGGMVMDIPSGTSFDIGESGYWWSSDGWPLHLLYNESRVYPFINYGYWDRPGFTVRCLKD